ncbi:MAG: hypothetical protein QW141_06950 [Ignisphaera sp.]
MPRPSRDVFNSKGDVYKYLNNSCMQITSLNIQEIVKNLENSIEAFVERFNETVQCVIAVKSCKGGASIAIVFDGKKKIFYGILDALHTVNNLGKIVDAVLGFLNRSAQIDCLKELKAIYAIADETIKIRFRCQFDLDALKAIILDAIFLTFFFANIQILQA